MAPDRRSDRRLSRATTGGSMRHLRAALAHIAGVFTSHRADDDLREELQAHLDMATAENIRRGMPPDEARRPAVLASRGLYPAGQGGGGQRRQPGAGGG